MTYGRYEYPEARAAALNDPTFENCDALRDWLDAYAPGTWNGEYYDIDEGKRLFPILGEEDEYGCFPTIGYEID